MTGSILLDHVQVTVPRETEAAALRFYRDALGLAEIPKPPELRANGGGWFMLGPLQLHVSPEDVAPDILAASKRHLGLRVTDLPALTARLESHGVAIIPDRQPVPGMIRIYVRDPGGNRLELFEAVS